MKSVLLFLFLIVLGLFGDAAAQVTRVHPYLGVSMNFASAQSGADGGSSTVGIGGEEGAQYAMFYLGIEYGLCGLSGGIDPSYTSVNGRVPEHRLGSEVYYGFHAGVVIDRIYWVGIVGLQSYADIQPSYSSSDTSFQSSIREYWFNIGPDLRWQFANHWMFEGAWTLRRGVKLGFGFILGRPDWLK